MPYFTAGYPDLQTTARLVREADRLGVAAVEVGFPYSDSIADGPTICASYQQALAGKLRVSEIFKMMSEVLADVSLAASAMVSYSIVDRVGLEGFASAAAMAGFDALIIPDLSLEEAGDVADVVRGAGLDLAMLVAPTSSPRRRRQICDLCSGFLYYVSVAGITGERNELPDDLPSNLNDLRTMTSLPICVGFGISTPEHVREVCRVADGAIVGSALIRRLTASLEAGHDTDRMISDVVALLADLQSATAKDA